MLFKRILSVLVISALLWPDVARCMQEEEENLPKNLSTQKQITTLPSNEEKTPEDPTPLPSKDLLPLIVKNTIPSSESKEEIKETPPPPPENNSTTENKTAVLEKKEETPSKGEEK